MTALKDSYTSTGAKFFHHQEAMQGLRNGKPQVVTTHAMLTDLCNHSCAFCSVHHRAGDSLAYDDVMAYLDILQRYGLKSVILSGGGNPILYKCKTTGKNFNDVVDAIHGRGLEIGLITNGMPLRRFEHRQVYIDRSFKPPQQTVTSSFRDSWGTVRPETLDKLTWVRISMAGLDHEEMEVFVPDIDRTKTTLGFSYVAHDIFGEPEDKAHGKVSTPGDLIVLDRPNQKVWKLADRTQHLATLFTHYCKVYKPEYLRVLPNCLEPHLIPERCIILQAMCDQVNTTVGRQVAFVQQKLPHAPKNCWIGYVHPVLSTDGLVYPCDSVVLAAAEVAYGQKRSEHKFNNQWAICHWSEVEKLFTEPIHSLVDSQRMCKGCVFHQQNAILEGVVDGTTDIAPPTETPTHANFV